VLLARGDTWFGRHPPKLLGVGAWAGLVGGVALLAVASVANPVVTVVGIAVVASASYLVLAIALAVLLAVTPPALRPHAGAVAGITVFGGLLAGASLPGQLAMRYGLTSALVAVALTYLGCAGMMRQGARAVVGDLGEVVDAETANEARRVLVSTGRRVPLLACRHVDFSYGQVQVLFDVDFTVDDGEMAALLGTNGAGKSTLLRVVSGLGPVSRGHVHDRGADITHVGAERRVGLGITQMPGGRAVFADLSVADNLKTFAFSLRRSRPAVDRGIDAVFDAFPQLARRRNQPAGTLSGGEQQMLGLGKAFILRPRLLLIDELSLGLAPIVVSRLLDMVRRINDEGTAIVLVEQSVNIALALVDHAYFMEKGEMRFDGPAQELVARPDLLRSVFLEGAAQGLRGAPVDVGASAPTAVRGEP
jgi:ABC-type branched-subunit amino acid transport system ATPase component